MWFWLAFTAAGAIFATSFARLGLYRRSDAFEVVL